MASTISDMALIEYLQVLIDNPPSEVVNFNKKKRGLANEKGNPKSKVKKLSSTVLRSVPGVLSISRRTENLRGVTLLLKCVVHSMAGIAQGTLHLL